MPWCPKCGSEYREGFTKCADCQVDLVGKLSTKEESDVAFRKNFEQLTDFKSSEYTEEELLEAKKNKVIRDTIGRVLPQPELGDEVLLVTIDNQVQYVYITSQLENENIPYRVMERDVGQYLTIYFGISYMGKTIFVDKCNFERADEIAKSMEVKEIEE